MSGWALLSQRGGRWWRRDAFLWWNLLPTSSVCQSESAVNVERPQRSEDERR
jgi:hypothetical protein